MSTTNLLPGLWVVVIISGLSVGGLWWFSLQRFLAAYGRAKAEGGPVEAAPDRLPWMRGEWVAGVPEAIVGRLLFATVAIAVPAVCFGIAASSNTPLTIDAWQSGLGQRLDILIGRDVSRVFYPFAGYGALSAGLLLLAPKRFSRYFIVRLGIYTGTLLALQYTVLLFNDGIMLISGVVGLLLLAPLSLGATFWRHTRRVQSRHFFWATLLLLFWVVAVLPAPLAPDPFGISGVIGVFGFIGLVAWVFPLGLWWSSQLIRLETEWAWQKIALPLGWLAGFGVAWTLAITRMFEIYNELPESPPPDCYIATAAAQGYPRLVGSFETATGGGVTFRINKQLQRLKAAELILLALSPALHGRVRRVYDRLGRRLARHISHPAVATVVYWSLKPAEWLTRLILWALGDPCLRLTERFYRPR